MIDQDDKKKNVVGSEPTNRHPTVILPVSGLIFTSSWYDPASLLRRLMVSSWCHPALYGPCWNHPGIILQKSAGKIKIKKTPAIFRF